MKRALLAALAAASLAACAPAVTAPTTFNFDLPADVELLCLQVPVAPNGTIDQQMLANMGGRVQPLQLTNCQTIDVNDNHTIHNMDPGPAGGPTYLGSRLFAVVTQSRRGEVSVVNLHPDFDTGPVDNTRTVPGFTFIPVGRAPSALAATPDGTATFVANTGDNFISVLDNKTLLASGEHRLQADNGSGPVQINLPSPAQDLAIVQRAGHNLLYATLPAASAVYVFDVTDPGAPGPAQVFALASAGGIHIGGMDGGTLDAGGMPGEGGVLDGGPDANPYPTTIQVADDGTVYVADKHSPFIHVLVPMGDTGLMETAPIDTGGVAIRTFAVSPTIGQHAVEDCAGNATGIPSIDTKRFIYAVSDVDGTMMVLDATSNTGPLRVNLIADRPECGAGGATFDPNHCPMLFPTINTTVARYDRVPLLAPATAVGFVSFTSNDQPCPGPYPNPVEACSLLGANTANLPQPTVLRGLQAVVALQTGQLQVVDVDDPDRNCAGANRTESAPCSNGARVNVRPFQPHIPRFAAPFLPLPVLTAAPLLQLLGANVTPSPELPSLHPMMADCTPVPDGQSGNCDQTNNWCVCLPQVPGFPGQTDPLAVHDDVWTLTYEGVIPGLTIDSGGFVAVDGATDQVTIQAPAANFCTKGALAGDHVIVTQDSPYVLPMDTNSDGGQVTPPLPAGPSCSGTMNGTSFCRAVFGDSVTPCNRQLEVLQAFNDHLLLHVVPDPTHCGPQMSTSDLLSALQCCYPETTQVAVRAAGAWTVVGQRTGYLHNVEVREPDGACVTGDRYPTGRAFENHLYSSPAFSLQIDSGYTMMGMNRVPQPTTRDTDFQFTVSSGVTSLLVDAGLHPTAIQYVCEDRRLYVVDQGRSSLYEYTISPLTSPRTFN